MAVPPTKNVTCEICAPVLGFTVARKGTVDDVVTDPPDGELMTTVGAPAAATIATDANAHHRTCRHT
jgi:hypothetical protein